MLKGCLSSADQRIKHLMLVAGKEELAYEQSLGGEEMEAGCHLFGLLLQLEVLRESVDHFSEAYRLKKDLPPVTIRRDQKENRNIFINSCITEFKKEEKGFNGKAPRIQAILEKYRSEKSR